MQIYCCGCKAVVVARLTTGQEIYAHREDLWNLPFWKCDHCDNYVGCHHKSPVPTRPLGCIPTPEIKNARQHIHRILDPLWRTGKTSRKALYARISSEFGRKYHTANIRSIEEAREIYRFIKRLAREAA